MLEIPLLPNGFFSFCKRHTLLLTMKSNGVTILKGKYFNLMVQQIIAMPQLLFLPLKVVETKNNDQVRILYLTYSILDILDRSPIQNFHVSIFIIQTLKRSSLIL